MRRSLGAGLGAIVALVLLAATAAAHARVSPEASTAGQLQLYSLVVPTERSGVRTERVVLSVPREFSIDSFVPSPGWHRQLQRADSGNGAIIQRVSWSGGAVPTGEDALFQFLAQPARAGRDLFRVQQTYSDGSIVNWTGDESSADPAPAIEVTSGGAGGGGGGGVDALDIVALILAALALAASALALVDRGHGGRPPA